jgi:non-haem Fe2+, alpha-ketoglutarate-dependent halogenase
MAEHDRRVSQLERDLRFFPVITRQPRTLSSEQILWYNARGYLPGIRAFTEPAVSANRQGFDDLLEQFLRAGKGSYAIDRYQDRIALLHDLARTPAILDVVEDILGPNVICWATHFFCKMPGDDKGVSWHQDCSYWPLTPSKTVTVWLAIDDADRDNGCMQVIPGTHLNGHLPFRESDEEERNVLTQTIERATRFGRPVDVELKAGEFSLHSDLLIHGSLPNQSKRRRTGLTLRYCPPDVRAYWDWNRYSIYCRGTDPSAHWANIPRPPEPFVLAAE